MRIIIATPLFPPDIASPATYAKELARRLATEHTVSILTYGELPEAVDGANVFAVSKKLRGLVRLWKFFTILKSQSKKSDIIVLLNGPSAELPTLITGILSRTPILFYLLDKGALNFSNPLYRFITKLVQWYATSTLISPHLSTPNANATLLTLPLMRPEILPFAPYPTDAFTVFEHSWTEHCDHLYSYIKICQKK